MYDLCYQLQVGIFKQMNTFINRYIKLFKSGSKYFLH